MQSFSQTFVFKRKASSMLINFISLALSSLFQEDTHELMWSTLKSSKWWLGFLFLKSRIYITHLRPDTMNAFRTRSSRLSLSAISQTISRSHSPHLSRVWETERLQQTARLASTIILEAAIRKHNRPPTTSQASTIVAGLVWWLILRLQIKRLLNLARLW